MEDKFALTLEQTYALIRGKLLLLKEDEEKELCSFLGIFRLHKIYSEIVRLYGKLAMLHTLKAYHHDFVVQILEERMKKNGQ